MVCVGIADSDPLIVSATEKQKSKKDKLALSPQTTSQHASLTVTGVISAGVSVPVQIPSQTPDLTGNYWPRLQ